jgi:hypothetical protein
MKNLKFFNLIIFLFLISSCSVPKKKHSIVGKWESTLTPKLVLSFDENNYFKGEVQGLNGYLYKYNRQYFIFDENNVKINDYSVGQQVIIWAKINNDKMNFHCEYKSETNKPAIVDLPHLCNYLEFTKVK